ncbi:MAG: heat-shock protein HtpX [Bifidobacterium tsurumiense]|uniref:arsenate-mycothiol transferase ArsC n=1 Tax=Bifidobacterium tsurumiense TaxID=356829 RepID=UPI002A829150|nr:heat-shock protein HtpX [Bifidobacterium tsurumiense]MDY4678464.1 heat-shock protein HtpX [Bifidobacterium tsurumiense]
MSDTTGNTVTIMFACRQNAGRSQMTAAVAKSLASDNIQILSAGSDPADEVHPVVVEALASIGLKPDSQPKQLKRENVQISDWVITMGCGESCPYVPGVHYEDWDIADPHGKNLDEVKVILSQITEKVRDLLERVTEQQPGSDAKYLKRPVLK